MAPARTPPFEIRIVGNSRVDLVAEAPLSFEAKGWQRALRSELRAAVAHLAAGPDEVLTGVYAGRPGPWRIDAENALFYNVGAGAFAGSAARGLRFERVFGPAAWIGADRRFAHAASYETAPVDAGFRFARRGASLATWEPVAIPAANGSPSATEIWSAMKTAADVRVERAGLCGGYFGLALRVAAPSGPVNAAALVKPFVDGVAASFSAHSGPDLDAVSQRIGEKLKRPFDVVARQLTAPPAVLLGTQRLVVCRSLGVQWLPPDDRCVACELIVDPAAGPSWRLSGSLFLAQPSPTADPHPKSDRA